MAKKPLSISQEDWDEPYAPVVCHPQNELAENLKDIEFRQAFEVLQEEYETVDVLLKARKQANLTQEEVAKRMKTTKSAVSRLESSLVNEQHSPSLSTLRRYAAALGYKLEISFVAR
ncbi:MAG TPA: helix-turn-helix transcriptional regulator [Agitococcus sp.]|nr:helix-turn-helix transcriptional regulator [Agitococcus sp.]HMX98256.1 helix-turn-helix transcriptional regulator [Agitococcus sp.]HNH44896.1 helix-turn-helix transcriptional regulator [Agitococcus sp.]HNL37189.1 helix-turn-helix transcriptional regulator [Agitococcus sp.]HNL81398.1 helix-turn-helix transcriptional regulator [Agitococcus sp.]